MENTELNKAEQREVSDEIGNQVLVHNRMHLTHTEAIRRIMIRLVDLEQLEEATVKARSTSETDVTEEKEIPQEEVSSKGSSRHKKLR